MYWHTVPRHTDGSVLVVIVHVYSAFDWLSLLLSPTPHPSAAAVIEGEGRRVNWTSHRDWWCSGWCGVIVQRWTTLMIWLKWRHYEWSSVRYVMQCDMLVAVFSRCTDLLSADMGDMGVRIIFDGVLYLKFHGKRFFGNHLVKVFVKLVHISQIYDETSSDSQHCINHQQPRPVSVSKLSLQAWINI